MCSSQPKCRENAPLSGQKGSGGQRGRRLAGQREAATAACCLLLLPLLLLRCWEITRTLPVNCDADVAVAVAALADAGNACAPARCDSNNNKENNRNSNSEARTTRTQSKVPQVSCVRHKDGKALITDEFFRVTRCAPVLLCSPVAFHGIFPVAHSAPADLRSAISRSPTQQQQRNRSCARALCRTRRTWLGSRLKARGSWNTL